MRLPILALLLPAALGAVPAAAGEGDDPFALKANPLKKGTEGWERTSGGEKAFVWTKDDATLSFKVPSGKDAPRVVNKDLAWDRFEARLQLRKGTRKLRLVLQPVPPSGPPGAPIFVDVPTTAATKAPWNDATLRVGDGKAALLVPDGAGEKEAAAAKLPPGMRFRFGFEASPGAEGAMTGVGLVRKYEDGPQACEEGFESVFDGKEMGSWQAYLPESADALRVENGFLVMEPRTQDAALMVLEGRWLQSYELRFRALWASTGLEVRALEVPGDGGRINQFKSVQVNLTDHLEPDNWNELAVRLAEGTCTVHLNGKKVADQKVDATAPATRILMIVPKGKRCYLRDLRLRDLAPGAAPPAPRPSARPAPEDRPAAPAAPAWKASGGFAETADGWEVAEAPAAGAGLLCGSAQSSSFTLRFKVGKGTTGLGVVPRANRGVERSPGIRLGDAYFEKNEWTEVVLEMSLLTAVVRVAGEEVGRLESENAVGAPALRVAGAGHARIKDLSFQPKGR